MTIVLGLLILLLIGLFFVMRFKLNAAAAPLFALALVVVVLTLFGMLDLLFVGGVLIAVFAVFCGVYVFAIKRYALKEVAAQFLRPGVIFFLAATVLFWVVLSAKNAYFRAWDEFSFWGTSCKLVFERNELYTLSINSVRNPSYPPGIALLSYFIQFFSNQFVEWRVYLIYNMALMAVMTVLFARVKWKNVVAILATTVFSIFSLYAFYWVLSGMYLYGTCYSDFMCGALFGGALLVWFSGRGAEDKTIRFFAAMAVLVFGVWVRDIGLALSLVGAGVIAVDMVITKDYPFKVKAFSEKKRVLNLLFPLILLLVVGLSYIIWSAHYSTYTGLSVTSDSYTNATLFDMLLGRDDYFNGILKTMWFNAREFQISSLGTLFETCLILAIAPFAAALLTWDKKRAMRIGSFGLLMTAGFAVYFLFYAYVYTAHASHSGEAFNFIRYLSVYPMGWLIADIGIFVFEIGRPKWKWLNFIPGIVLMLGLVVLNYTSIELKPSEYVIFYDEIKMEMPYYRDLYERGSNKFGNSFAPDDRVYFAAMGSIGSEWFLFGYEYTQLYTLKEMGGGNFVGSEEAAEQTDYGTYATRETFTEYLLENEADYIYVNSVSDYFLDEFGPMFDDGLQMFYDGSVNFYKIHYNNGEMTFEPIWSAEQVAAYTAQKQSAQAAA